jgi:hypothetical protein
MTICGSGSEVRKGPARRRTTNSTHFLNDIRGVKGFFCGKEVFDSVVCLSCGRSRAAEELRNDILGGMAFELDSEMLRRLQENYGGMSDGELLELAAKPADLTETAREVLRGEMTRRGISLDEVKQVERAESLPGVVPLPSPEYGENLPVGSVVLNTFYDAMSASEACDLLEAEGVQVDVRDVSQKDTTGGSFYGGPPVALEVIVPTTDRDRSVKLLREKMGLFPLQEVEEADEALDDGTVMALGFFGKREDAEAIAKALDDAKIWHRIVANAEGTVEDENAFSLEVREVDMVAAGDVVEKAIS